MEAVVNHKYRYVMYYSPKVGCSSLRNLFLALHRDELSEEKLSELNSYHNLSEIFPYEAGRDFSGYYKFNISRNPYSRIVSAYFDQYVYNRNSGVDDMFDFVPPKGGPPNTFVEFLEYLKRVPDKHRDSHFKTQSFFYHDEVEFKKQSFWRRPNRIKSFDYIGDISTFAKSVDEVYKKIFNEHDDMYQKAIDEISRVPKLNSLIYSDEVQNNVAELTVDELNDMPYAPLPQYFFTSPRVKKLVGEIYADDFKNFNYSRDDVPEKKPSRELSLKPADFNWETYLLLNPDLQLHDLTSEREVLRHYLQTGIHEENTRYYKIKAPKDFNWKKYLEQRDDLVAGGINTEREAIIHYLSYGKNEEWHSNQTK